MRRAIISDIHSNSAALDAVLADIDRRGISNIVNLGDCFSGPMDAAATAARLMEREIPTVMGNHDRQLVDRPRSEMGAWELYAIDALSDDHLNWIRALPPVIEDGPLFCCHATPTRDDAYWVEYSGPQNRLIARDLPDVERRLGDTDAKVIACGHTHKPRVIRLPGGPLIINPGAVGIPAHIDTRTEPNFIHQTGAPDARYAILEDVGGDWVTDLVTVPYDSSEMAALARAHGADYWAQALETGWIA